MGKNHKKTQKGLNFKSFNKGKGKLLKIKLKMLVKTGILKTRKPSTIMLERLIKDKRKIENPDHHGDSPEMISNKN